MFAPHGKVMDDLVLYFFIFYKLFSMNLLCASKEKVDKVRGERERRKEVVWRKNGG